MADALLGAAETLFEMGGAETMASEKAGAFADMLDARTEAMIQTIVKDCPECLLVAPEEENPPT